MSAGPDHPLLARGRVFLDLLSRAAGGPVALPEAPDPAALWAQTRAALRRRPALAGAGSAAQALAGLDTARRQAADPEAFGRLAHAGACPERALARFAPEALGLDDPVYARVASQPVPQSPPSGFGSLVLIVKLTRRCNLRCTYCNDWREGADTGMSPATQALMLRRIAEDEATASVRLIWHGGEPALLGPRRMLGFLWLQARLLRPGQRVGHSLQTNGTVLTEGVLALWQLFGFSVSVSLDGTRAIHDRQRPARHGAGSFDAASRGIARLREAGILGGALVVVTPEIAALPPAELVAGLIEAGVQRAGFLPVRPDAATGQGPYLPPRAFAAFLIGIFDHLRSHPALDFDVREIDALHAAWQRRQTSFCELEGPCTGQYFGIDPDGTVQHCDKFLDDADFRLGHLARDSLAELRGSAALGALSRRAALARARLAGCRWFGHCKGWCPHEAHIADRRGSSGGCCGLAPVFDHFQALATPLRPCATA